jgi:hypothetical protein
MLSPHHGVRIPCDANIHLQAGASCVGLHLVRGVRESATSLFCKLTSVRILLLHFDMVVILFTFSYMSAARCVQYLSWCLVLLSVNPRSFHI